MRYNGPVIDKDFVTVVVGVDTNTTIASPGEKIGYAFRYRSMQESDRKYIGYGVGTMRNTTPATRDYGYFGRGTNCETGVFC